MGWTPRIVTNEGALVAAEQRQAQKVTVGQNSGLQRVGRKPRRAKFTRETEIELGAIIAGVSRLSIDGLLWRPIKERMFILNGVTAELASLADWVVKDTHAITTSGHEPERDLGARVARAARLFDDLGRLLNYGRMMNEEQRGPYED